MTRSAICFLLAVVAFVVLLVIAVFDIDASAKLTQGLFYGGLALFAGGHLEYSRS